MPRTIEARLAVLTLLGAALCATAGEPPTPDPVRPTADKRIADEAKEPPEAGETRLLTFGLYTGVQYDDNIILRNERIPGDKRPDWKSINALSIDARLLDDSSRASGVRYNAYQTFIDSHDELQLTGNTLTLYHAEFHAPVVLYVPASFSHYDVRRDEYLDLYSVSPALFVEESSHLVGVLRGAVRGYDYASLPDNDFHDKDRSSILSEVGAEQWLLFGDDGRYRLELGYTYRNEHANKADWSNNQNEGRLGVRAKLPGEISLESAVTYTDKDYSNRNDIFDKHQRDNTTAVGASISRPLSPLMDNATLSLSWLYTEERSNEESQEYRRHQLTLGLAVRF